MTHLALSAKHQSVWAELSTSRERPPLRGAATADTCVVGAGIAGLSIAYMLALEGQQVIVLDDGPIGGGQTEVTTAHLSYVLDRRFYDLVDNHGKAHAKLAIESHATAIDRIEAIVRRESINCDFIRAPGYLFAHDTSQIDVLDHEYETAHKLGRRDVMRLARGPLPLEDLGPCVVFPKQAQFHPLKYLLGMASAFERMGGRIHCGSHVTQVDSGAPAQVVTRDGHAVTADHVVVATNTPINDLLAIHTKQAPYLTYVVALRVPRKSLPTALFWDTADPFHYVRLQAGEDSDHDLLIVGGEDHKTGQANDGEARLARLEDWARLNFPGLGDVEYTWAGQVMESADGLAFIGRNPGDEPNVYVATGDSGLGMTHGTIAGMLICDLILERENAWKDVYNPSRLVTGALANFVKENLNVAAQYSDWMTPGDVASVDEIERGQGAVLREGLTKVAVYRDEQGQLTRLSAVCPHLKCVVHWDRAESTWDCPCHGSRFSPEGKVLNGPANVDLPRIE